MRLAGDPDGLRASQHAFEASATGLMAAVRPVGGVIEVPGWDGPHAETYAHYLHSALSRLRSAAQALGETAQAIGSLAAGVDRVGEAWTRAQAKAALIGGGLAGSDASGAQVLFDQAADEARRENWLAADRLDAIAHALAALVRHSEASVLQGTDNGWWGRVEGGARELGELAGKGVALVTGHHGGSAPAETDPRKPASCRPPDPKGGHVMYVAGCVSGPRAGGILSGSLRAGSTAAQARMAAAESGYPIPPNYIARPADNGQGWVFRAPGTRGNANIVRVGEEDAKNPNGYVRYYNGQGQPLTAAPEQGGSPGDQPGTHLPLLNGPEAPEGPSDVPAPLPELLVPE